MTIPWDGALCRQVTPFELGAHAEQAASGAVVARADYYAGAWDDAVLHADRAITVSIESEFALSHPLAFFAAALVSAARGDRQTAATRLNLADELEASGTRDLSSAMAAYRWNRQPARPKSWYLSAADNPADADDWMSVAQRTSGSWWSDWAEWSVEHADELTSPPPIGSATYPVLGPGPGTYVFT